jgi:hypothetical protein
MPTAAIRSYRQDPLYAGIVSATNEILRRGRVVTPVDVLIAMSLLSREHLGEWRRGRLPYLERVIHCTLPRLSRLLRILRFHAEEIDLKPSFTAYMRWGGGQKSRLRFTKSGDPGLEEAYATHFLHQGFNSPAAPGAAAALGADAAPGGSGALETAGTAGAKTTMPRHPVPSPQT